MKRALMLLIVVAIGVGTYLNFISDAASFSAADTLADIAPSAPTTTEAIEQNASYIIRDHGIAAALEVVGVAFANQDIYLNDCHALAHFIGHFAPGYYRDDFDKVVQHMSHFCAKGYIHGAEAQLAIEGDDYIDRLHKLCDAIKKADTDMICFHGAGHAFMNQTIDVRQSLALCDTLRLPEVAEREVDVQDCYEGVFSEVVLLAHGSDGETARAYEGEKKLTIEGTPLEYCAQFATIYQAECALELMGMSVNETTSPDEAGQVMRSCLTETDSHILLKACLYNTAASYVRHEIASSGKVTFQPWILEQPDEIRRLYLVAAGQEIAQHVLGGQMVDTDIFCESFVRMDEVSLCKQQVSMYGLAVRVMDKLEQ